MKNRMSRYFDEKTKQYQIRIPTPKAQINDLDISIEQRTLKLNVKGSIYRWKLPEDAKLNHITAKLQSNLLTITIPRYKIRQFHLN